MTHPLHVANQRHLDRVRKTCLAYPEVVEVVQFGAPWFKAGKKAFCIYGAEERRSGACFNLTPEHQSVLIEDERFSKTHYVGQHGWTTMVFSGRVEWSLVEELIDQAYRKVALKRMLKQLDDA
ncbi:MAG: MmcQ/YjbR family DNA-binding protein [Acidobacteriota bacterium]